MESWRKVDLLMNEIATGKNDDESTSGVVNSRLPCDELWSMRGMDHTTLWMRWLYENAPASQSTSFGEVEPVCVGIVIATSRNSRAGASSSNSRFTWLSDPVSDGQHVTRNGNIFSSFDCTLQRKMPSGFPTGNGRDGSFKPSTLLEVNSALSMFGCVRIWNSDDAFAMATEIRIAPKAASDTRSMRSPLSSMFSTSPPSRLSTALIFSTVLKCTLSVEIAG
mmetsp:Transcript_7628/g.16259  ORF Transcript_7628/g.16259 Transcript_7628/m.16259 type:complete len:222 (+) Transcript_7628:82-747(+)